MNKRFSIAVIGFVLSLGSSYGQSGVNRYFVFFSDKVDENYPYRLDEPGAFLTERSIERRSRQGIELDSTDLPVNPSYISQLTSRGYDVFFSSKWLNGALIQTSSNRVSALSSLPFVDSVALIAEFAKLTLQQVAFEEPSEFQDPPAVGGDSDIQVKMLGVQNMHDDGFKGQGMLVAVFDNGFKGVDQFTPFQHLWESDQIFGTRDFVSNSGNVFLSGDHGTAVFSTIGALYSEGNFTGILPAASFILCITEEDGSEDRIEEYNWLLAAEYADSLGVDVINASVGYRRFDIEEHNYTKEDLDGTTAVISKAATIAAEKGIVVVTSAGNTGTRSYPGNLISHPADAIGILAVGSVLPNFEKSDFSSFGPTKDGRIKPDVAAFGDGTAVIRSSGRIERGGGTSFASPLIAGFAGGIWQANPSWTSEKVIEAIKNSGHKNTSPDTLLGWGVPNYSYAVNGQKALSVNDILEDKVTVYPNPFRGDTLFLKTQGVFKKGLQIKIMDTEGRLVFSRDYKRREIKETIELTLDSSQQGVYFLFLQTENNQKVVKLVNF